MIHSSTDMYVYRDDEAKIMFSVPKASEAQKRRKLLTYKQNTEAIYTLLLRLRL